MVGGSTTRRPRSVCRPRQESSIWPFPSTGIGSSLDSAADTPSEANPVESSGCLRPRRSSPTRRWSPHPDCRRHSCSPLNDYYASGNGIARLAACEITDGNGLHSISRLEATPTRRIAAMSLEIASVRSLPLNRLRGSSELLSRGQIETAISKQSLKKAGCASCNYHRRHSRMISPPRKVAAPETIAGLLWLFRCRAKSARRALFHFAQ
jgi:hypothetical protein